MNFRESPKRVTRQSDPNVIALYVIVMNPRFQKCSTTNTSTIDDHVRGRFSLVHSEGAASAIHLHTTHTNSQATFANVQRIRCQATVHCAFSSNVEMSSTENKNSNASFAKACKPYFCGGSAAMFASSCIHPIDLVKVRLQLVGMGSSTGTRPGAVAVAKSVIQQEGVGGLYRGLSASLTRQATYGTARIGLYQAFSDKVSEWRGVKGPLPLGWKFATSFTSGAMASCIGNPFDVSLVRMQADAMQPANERRNYKGVVDAVTRITREEGFGALYHGFRPTLLRAIAMNVGMMASYDTVKETVTELNGKGTSTDLISSAAAGFFCAFFSLPFDMMKTRLQNMKQLPDGKMQYNGLLDCATQIFKNEGFFAFWRGFGAFYGRCAPHAMIILLSREQIIKAYDKFLLD